MLNVADIRTDTKIHISLKLHVAVNHPVYYLKVYSILLKELCILTPCTEIVHMLYSDENASLQLGSEGVKRGGQVQYMQIYDIYHVY